MITELTDKDVLVSEYREDKKRALYWFNKELSSMRKPRNRWEVVHTGTLLYESPRKGNKWMFWWRDYSSYLVCYRTLAKYMEVITETWTLMNDGTRIDSISIFTSHYFQRLFDRLGMKVSDDRLAFIRRFANIMSGASYQYYEEGGKLKLAGKVGSAALCVGDVVPHGDVYLVYNRSFMTKAMMTPAQKRKWKDLLS